MYFFNKFLFFFENLTNLKIWPKIPMIFTNSLLFYTILKFKKMLIKYSDNFVFVIFLYFCKGYGLP